MMNRLLATLTFALALAGCSSSSSGTPATSADGGGEGGGITADQACADLAHARCTALETCSTLRIATQYGDEATCEARNKANCVASLAAPSTGAAPATSEACAMAYTGWSCPDLLDGTNIPGACQQPKGSLAAGSACAFPGQCQSGFCAIAPDAACGVCAAPPKAGDSCAALTNCGQGLLCTSDTQVCATYVTQGGMCGKGMPCGTGMSCVGSTTTTPGTCQTAVATMGAACDPAAKTGPACDRDKGLTCNSTSKTCVTLATVGGGQACGDVSGSGVACSASGVCNGAMGTTAGTCAAAVADGASCSTPGLKGCEALARCIVAGEGGATGTCAMQSASACH